jgi:hypothetical protein
MSVRVFFDVLNQKGSPALYTDSFSNRPAFGFQGRLFIATDTRQIYEDMGDRWELIADAGAGSGNLQSVTTNGNYTTTDIDLLSGNLIYRKLSPGSVLFLNTSEIVTEDNSNFFWDDTLNRLGIGTNTPTATFDVHSTDNVIQQLNATGTNNSLLSFLNQGTGKWRIGNFYNSANNDFYIFDVLSGTPRFYLLNTGYAILPNSVIIGSSNRSSSYGLDVYVSANYQSTLRVQGVTTLLSQINGTFASFTGDLTIATNKLYVNSSTGNVGIGTITPSGGFGTTSTGTLLDIYDSSVIGGNGGALVLSALSNSSRKVNLGQIRTILTSGTPSAETGDMVFSTMSAATLTERMRILSSGNVGIGTSSPNSVLEVYGQTRISASLGSVLLITPDATSTNGVTLDTSYYGSAGYGPLKINTGGIERMRITSGGNVLIGTTTDYGNKLNVAGDIAAVGVNPVLFSSSTVNSTSYGFYNNGSGTFILTNRGVANVGAFNMSTGVYTPTSDFNKKKDFETSTIGLNAILSLKPTLYRMKSENDSEKHLGFIAQEVKEFIPQAYVESENFIGLDFNPIVATLVKAIQELKEEIDQLKGLLNK